MGRRADGQTGRRSVLLALAVLTTPPTLQAQGDLKTFFRQAVAEEGIVGAGMLIVGRDGVVDSAFAGFADRDSRRPVTSQSVFHWASITKTFTAIGVMQLRDRGRLSIEDPIVNYVPELDQAHNPYGTMSDVKTRHLLSHSSGFRNPTWPWGGDKPWHPFEPTHWAQVVAMLPYSELLFAPGSQYGYSNPGYIFLGRTIEKLTGEDYEVYVEKNVLRPLGMSHSYFDITPYHLLANRSNNYYLRDGIAVANGLDFDTGITVSNGGLNAPLADMALYLRFLLGGSRPSDPPVIARSTLDEMWRPVSPGGGEYGPKSRVGLGYFIVERDGVRLIGHTGSQAGFRSFFWIHPESGKAIIAVFNTSSPPDAPEGKGVKPDIERVFAGMVDRFVAGISK
jgi:CubicO group peptidase (beta-lactamase class C family)